MSVLMIRSHNCLTIGSDLVKHKSLIEYKFESICAFIWSLVSI